MPRYRVELRREVTQYRTVLVYAPDEEEARRLATRGHGDVTAEETTEGYDVVDDCRTEDEEETE